MKKYLFILTAFASLTGCYYDNKQDLYPSVTSCDTTGVTYSGKVVSIIQSQCYSCHSASTGLGNVVLEGYSNLKAYADNGKLVGVIEHSPGFSPMPQGASKMSDCEIAVIKKWIADGALQQ